MVTTKDWRIMFYVFGSVGMPPRAKLVWLMGCVGLALVLMHHGRDCDRFHVPKEGFHDRWILQSEVVILLTVMSIYFPPFATLT